MKKIEEAEEYLQALQEIASIDDNKGISHKSTDGQTSLFLIPTINFI